MDTNKNETALALSHDFLGHIMSPADFSVLDQLIQKIGDRSASLSDHEKTAATEVIESWNQSVVARIEANASQASDVLDFMSGKPMSGTQADQVVELFHSFLGDTPEYQAYAEALQAYMDLSANEPVDEPVDGAMSLNEADRIIAANRTARLAHQRDMQAANRRYAKAVKAYIKSVNELPEAKEAKAKLSSYKRGASRMAAECRDKASLAKLNISVSDPNTRDLLRELMDFAKKV